MNRDRIQKELGLFAMDTFKVTQKLTLDYGLRWDYFTSPYYKDGLQYAFDQQSGNVIAPASVKTSPLYPSNIKIVTGNVVPTPDRGNFRPRLGFAYRLRDTLVVRGGRSEERRVGKECRL